MCSCFSVYKDDSSTQLGSNHLGCLTICANRHTYIYYFSNTHAKIIRVCVCVCACVRVWVSACVVRVNVSIDRERDYNQLFCHSIHSQCDDPPLHVVKPYAKRTTSKSKREWEKKKWLRAEIGVNSKKFEFGQKIRKRISKSRKYCNIEYWDTEH